MKCPALTDLPSAPRDKRGWPWDKGSDAEEWLAKRSHWPRVSIVMPSYNQGAYIEESIRSVLLQGYPDLEFFVYDAESTDDTVGIIKKYESWLTYWVSEKDKGQSDAINKGLAKSTGDYFNWQNSDDVFAPCSLFKSVDAMLNHPAASYVHGYRYVIYADGRIHSCSEKVLGPPTRFHPDVGSSIALLKTGMQPGGLMNCEMVKKVGGIDESMHFAMDMDILLKLSLLGRPLYVHEDLVRYRFHEETKTHSVWSKERRLEKLRIVQSLFKMPESIAFRNRRREAMATGHRYAADCCWMLDDRLGFLYHLLMDALWAPIKGFAARRALFYYIRQRKKGVKMGATAKQEYEKSE